MGCACKQKRDALTSSVTTNSTDGSGITIDSYKTNIELEPVAPISAPIRKSEQQTTVTLVAATTRNMPAQGTMNSKLPEVVTEAIENDLKSCYLCAKKHLVRAQIFFEEYHTGYPDHIKNLVQSLRVAEAQVRGAFLRWQKVMGHLDMAANELLGNDINSPNMSKEHIILANKIRDVRLRLSDNPLISINFDELITKVHLLQYKELEG